MKRFLCVFLSVILLGGCFAVSASAQPGYGTVRYAIDGAYSSYSVRTGSAVTLRSEYAMRQYENRMIVGWRTEDGKTYYYDNTDFWRADGKTDLVLQSEESCTLYPIWCPIALRKEEVFSFTNSESVFNADVDGYWFTRQHFMRILPNWFCTFALSPFAPIAALLCTFFLFIWPTFPFYGSCSGFSIAALLQHEGKIDLLREQGVSAVCELEPDDTVQSTINYYNIHAVAGLPTNHLALLPGTDEYGKQLHALYDTLESGTPVYFELYGNGPHLLRRLLLQPTSIIRQFDDLTAHGVLLTGAYTDGRGNHILIMYDNNSMRYADGTCSILYIDPDFTQIYSSYAYSRDYALDGFSWNDSLSQFDSFRTKGVSNPFSWHIRFLKNLPSLLRQVIPVYKNADRQNQPIPEKD